MSDISKIVLPDGNVYNIKDTVSGYQERLVSGTNIKTINNQSILGSGNISISTSGTQPNNYSTITVSNGTSVASASPESSTDTLALVSGNNISLGLNDTGHAITINASVPSAGTTASAVGTTSSGGSASTYSKSDHVHSISSSTITSALGYTPYNSTNPSGYTSNTGTITGIKMNGSSKGTSGVVDLGTVITAHQDISGKVSKSGDTMTGQLLTSYKSSVAMGSYGTAQTTIAGFLGEVRYSSGCMGSVSIGTAYTYNGITIPTGWYNFIFSPHRTGGLNGEANGDNCNYGTLILNGMTGDFGTFIIRTSSGGVGSLQRISMSSGAAIAKSTASSITSTTANYFYKIALSSLTTSGASSLFEIGNGGVKITKAGKYKISASCYFQSNASGCCPSVYVRSSTSTISDSSSSATGMGTELLGMSIPATTVAMPVTAPPMLVDIRANTYLYLVARPRQATTGGIVCNNNMTWLQVEYEG